MNVIVWRHAEADNTSPDLARQLTPRGLGQAAAVGAWLDQHLPARTRVICSPAVRTVQTAQGLGRDYAVDHALAPDVGRVADYLAVLEGPGGDGNRVGAVVVVGHQPTVGRLAHRLLTGREADLEFGKAAAWWFEMSDPDEPAVLRSVIDPDLI